MFSFLLFASAKLITVNVGDAGLAFNPPSITAVEGDTVQFQFYPKNHTVTQSTFAAPCTAMAGGGDSGFLAVAANATEIPVWSFTLNNASAPLWFYCAQGTHCSAGGMVFAVNPTAEKSFEAFQAAATGGGNATASGSAGTSASASASSSAPSAAGAIGTNGNDGVALKSMSYMLTLVGVIIGLMM